MKTEKNKELNQFIVSAPAGTIFTSAWLQQHGISAKLAWWYVHSGLLQRFGAKAYKKTGKNISWVGAVSAMQNQMNLPVSVGGITALQLLRRVKKSPMFSARKIELFADLGTRIPSWFKNKNFGVNFKVHRTSLFGSYDGSLGIVEKEIDGITIKHSCFERAAMEIIFLSPKYYTLYDLTELMEKLKGLQPDIVQLLLENCNSIKVKRFFLYYVNRFRRGFLSQLDLSKINLGSGKRVIGRGGTYRYHPKFMLSLPEKIDEPGNDFLD